ncbi:SCO family protein [Kaarinaea lacus]
MPVSKLSVLVFHILTIIVVLNQSACTQSDVNIPKDLKNILLATPIKIEPFELTTQHGTPFTAEQLRNHWTFLFFGYTHCPDICPTTLTELAAMAEQIPQGSQSQIVFVSVDPERDTVEYLKEYITFFNEQFLGLTGQMASINNLTKQLNIKHTKEPAAGNNYAVNHSSAVLLIDPKGRYVAKFTAPHYAERMQSAFEHVKQYIQAAPQS